MKLSTLRRLGFTLIELLVVISIIGILASLAIPAVTGALVRGQMTGQMSNMKQLHLATQSMALDSQSMGDTNMGWPGDTGGTWSVWATNIVGGQYMSTNEFNKMLSAANVLRPANTAPDAKTPSAVVVYQVKETSDGTTTFLSSANYTNTGSLPTTLNADARPFGNKGFVVFRKGGDGTVFPKIPKSQDVIGTNVDVVQ